MTSAYAASVNVSLFLSLPAFRVNRVYAGGHSQRPVR